MLAAAAARSIDWPVSIRWSGTPPPPPPPPATAQLANPTHHRWLQQHTSRRPAEVVAAHTRPPLPPPLSAADTVADSYLYDGNNNKLVAADRNGAD